jgi:hypothetical protein
MTHVTRLAAWVELNREVLEQHGRVSFTYGPSGTNNPSAHLSVALSTDEGAELLIWESGDVEFNRGSFAAPVFEHVDLESPDDLAALLGRFLDVVTGGS